MFKDLPTLCVLMVESVKNGSGLQILYGTDCIRQQPYWALSLESGRIFLLDLYL